MIKFCYMILFVYGWINFLRKHIFLVFINVINKSVSDVKTWFI